jgi:hypothetical protein
VVHLAQDEHLNESKSDQVGYCWKVSYELRWLGLSIRMQCAYLVMDYSLQNAGLIDNDDIDVTAL